MAFENINVTSLKNAINSCINSLDSSTTKQLKSDLANDNIWKSDSRKQLINALDKLDGTRYKDLKKKLKSYLSLVEDIEEYQKLDKENDSLRNKNSSLNSKLYKTEKEIKETKDSNGKVLKEETEKQVKDTNVESQINSNKNKIESNKDRMSTLKSRVNNSI